MKLKPIRANMTELQLGDKTILFSYETPVAYFDRKTNKYHKTKNKLSQTTTRHIIQWTLHLSEGVNWWMEDQETLDNLVANK